MENTIPTAAADRPARKEWWTVTISEFLREFPQYKYSDFQEFSRREADGVLSVHADPIHRLAAVATATLDFSVELLQQARTPEPIDVGRFVADFAGLEVFSALREELIVDVLQECKWPATVGLTFGRFPTAANSGLELAIEIARRVRRTMDPARRISLDDPGPLVVNPEPDKRLATWAEAAFATLRERLDLANWSATELVRDFHALRLRIAAEADSACQAQGTEEQTRRPKPRRTGST